MRTPLLNNMSSLSMKHLLYAFKILQLIFISSYVLCYISSSTHPSNSLWKFGFRHDGDSSVTQSHPIIIFQDLIPKQHSFKGDCEKTSGFGVCALNFNQHVISPALSFLHRYHPRLNGRNRTAFNETKSSIASHNSQQKQKASSTALPLSNEDGTRNQFSVRRFQRHKLASLTATRIDGSMTQVEPESSSLDGTKNATRDSNKELPLSTLYTYTDMKTNITLQGLDVSLTKFETWVQYFFYHYYQGSSSQIHNKNGILFYKQFEITQSLDFQEKSIDPQLIETEQIHVDSNNAQFREQLRRVWCEGRLISDRTEMMANYGSDEEDSVSPQPSFPFDHQTRLNRDTIIHDQLASTFIDKSKSKQKKRGGFSDLLHMYADRFLGILEDEKEDFSHLSLTPTTINGQGGDMYNSISTPSSLSRIKLLDWMKREYGQEKIHYLLAQNLLNRTPEIQYEVSE